MNVAGFHFHAIVTNMPAGGHVLDCELQAADVEIDTKEELRVQFADDAPPRPSPPPPHQDGTSPQAWPPVSHW